jgi:hypothetical protein
MSTALGRDLLQIDRLLAACARRAITDPEPAARLAKLLEALSVDHRDGPVSVHVPDEAAPALVGLARIAKVHELTPFDRDLLLLAAAQHIDTRYVRVLGILCGGPPSFGALVDLLVDHFGLPREVALSRTGADAPLVRHALIRSDAGGVVRVPEPIWRRILGIDGGSPFALIARHAIDDLVVPAATREAFDRAVKWARRQARCAVVVRGRDGHGRSAIAAALADALERRALAVGPDADPAEVVREARWFGAIPVVSGPAAAPADLAALADPGVAIVIADQTGTVQSDLPVLELEVMPPGRDERTRLWRRGLGPTAIDLGGIVDRRLGPGEILNATRRARELADARGALSDDDLRAACRAITSAAPGAGALRIEPAFALADLVLAPAHLAAAANLSCLFWGPPGTGKTMAAHVVARELGLDLLRVDMSRVVDKYIGETEKNLARLFDDAELHNHVLLFDEADALFGRRTEQHDAHDRFANIETGYLLQRLEQHRGVVVLATNLRQNLDPAFLRRLHVIAEFPLPAPAERRELWARLVPAPRADDVDLGLLANVFALSGGDIRNAVLTALVLANEAPIAMRHLVIGVWRELSRSGRLVDGTELGPWQREVTAWIGR